MARVALRIQPLKEDANGERRSVEAALDAHATEHRLPRDYSDAFFPRIARAEKEDACPPRPCSARCRECAGNSRLILEVASENRGG